MKFESKNAADEVSFLKDFYTFVIRELPEGLLGEENSFPVKVGDAEFDVVIFEPYDGRISFGLFVKEDQRIPVTDGEEFPGHIVGKYSRKTLEIDEKGNVTEDTFGKIPDFDKVENEPDLDSITNTSIATQVLQQIKSYKRPHLN